MLSATNVQAENCFPLPDTQALEDAAELVGDELEGLYEFHTTNVVRHTQLRKPVEPTRYPYVYVAFTAVWNEKSYPYRFTNEPFYYLHYQRQGYKFEGVLKLRYVYTRAGWLHEIVLRLRCFPLDAYR